MYYLILHQEFKYFLTKNNSLYRKRFESQVKDYDDEYYSEKFGTEEWKDREDMTQEERD